MKKIIAILMMVFPLSIFSQAVWIVDDDDPAADFNNIQNAVTACQAGDTIKVQPGLYPGEVTIGKKIILMGLDTTAIISNAPNAIRMNSGSAGTVIRNLKIMGNIYFAYTNSGEKIIISSNAIYGDMSAADQVILANNICYDTQINAANGAIIYNNTFLKTYAHNKVPVTVGGNEKSTLVLYNVFKGDHARAIYTNGLANIIANTFDGVVIAIQNYSNGSKIYNNIFKNSNIGISYYTGNVGAGILANNIFYNLNTGIDQEFSIGITMIINNIFYNVTTIDSRENVSEKKYWYNCFYNSGVLPQGLNNMEADPQFVDAANGDFSLQSSSPCINAGNPDKMYLDLDLSRNDMGIYGGSHSLSNYENTNPAVLFMNVSVLNGNLRITGGGIGK